MVGQGSFVSTSIHTAVDRISNGAPDSTTEIFLRHCNSAHVTPPRVTPSHAPGTSRSAEPFPTGGRMGREESPCGGTREQKTTSKNNLQKQRQPSRLSVQHDTLGTSYAPSEREDDSRAFRARATDSGWSLRVRCGDYERESWKPRARQQSANRWRWNVLVPMSRGHVWSDG